MSNLLKSKFLLGVAIVAVMFVGVAVVNTPTAAGASCAITKTLRVGSKGDEVKCLQEAVGVTADGKFGPLTKAAVVAWQTSKGLVADGVFGKKSNAVWVAGSGAVSSGSFAPEGCTSASGYSPVTGGACYAVSSGTTTTLPAGCTSTSGYSPTTGVKCDSATGSTTTTPTTGSLTASLSSSNPAAATLADGSAYNSVMALSFTAGSGAVNLTGLRVTRQGFSLNSDFSGVMVFDSAGNRHGNVVTFSEDKALIQFASDPIIVAAGQTATVWVKANLVSSSSLGTFSFAIASASDVMTNSADSVGGSFPIKGNIFSVVSGASFLGAVSVDSVTISSSVRNVDLGQKDYQIGKFRIYETASKEDIQVSSIRFYNNGNTTDADLANLKLTNDSTGEVLATATGTVGKYVTFTLATPLKILKGQNKTIAISADVVNGSSRTAQFIIQNDYDINVSGVATASGILVTHSTGFLTGDATAGFPVGDAANYNTISVTAGTLTVTKDVSSPSADLALGQNAAVLGVWKIEAVGEDIELQKADFSITGSTVAADFSGSVSLVAVSSTGAETSLYSTSTLAPLLDDDAAATDQVTLSNYYIIPSNTSILVKLVANISSSATNARTTIGNLSDVYYHRISTNNYATASSTTFITANTRTISTATVTVAKNSSFGNQNIVAGGGETKIGSYIIQAGGGEGVNVSAINVDMSAIGGWTNMKLKKVNADGTETQVGATVSAPSATDDANSFSVGGQLNIAVSTSVVVNVYASASSSAVTVTTDIDASDVTASGYPSGASISTIPASAVTGQTITVQTSGTLLVETDTSTPVEAVVHSGQTGVELLKLKLTSQYEAISISKLVFNVKSGNANLSALSITAGAVTVSNSVINGLAEFSNLTLTVPKDSSLSITVKGSFTSSGTLVSAEEVRVGLNSMIATGASGARVYELARTTTDTATNIGADVSATLTVGSTVGFAVGDVVQINTGGSLVTAFTGMVTSIGSATAMDVIGPQDLEVCATTAGDTCYVTKWATREAVTSNSSTAEVQIVDKIATAIDVSSTRGFAAGDVVRIKATDGATATDDGGFYTVTAVTDGNTMTVIGVGEVTASPYFGNSVATDRVTRMATSAATQVRVISSIVANTTSLIDVDSTLGFAVGDVVVINSTVSTAATKQLYVVDAITDADTISVIGKGAQTSIPVDSWVTKLATTQTTTVSTASVITADTASAVTLTSTSGFAVGDIVYIQDDATAGGDLYMVSAVSSTTITVVGETGFTASVGAFVTRLASSTANSKPYTVHDVEPAIGLNTASPGASGTVSGATNQVVAIFDVKADGEVPLTIKAMTLTRGGNIGTRVATSATPKLYDYSSGSLGALLGTGGVWTGTTSGSTSAITLDTPYDVSAGQTLKIAVTVDTSAAAANDTFQVYLNNTSGLAGLFGGMSWYYTANSPSPGTEPTNASPSTLADTYPVFGNTLRY